MCFVAFPSSCGHYNSPDGCVKPLLALHFRHSRMRTERQRREPRSPQHGRKCLDNNEPQPRAGDDRLAPGDPQYYIIPKMLRRNVPHIVHGDPQAGKSTYICQLLDDLCERKEMFGHPTTGINPCYIICDRDAYDLKETFNRIGRRYQYPYYDLRDPQLGGVINAAGLIEVERLLEAVKRLHPECDFVVLDPSTALVSDGHVNNLAVGKFIRDRLTPTCARLGITIMMVHHDSKGAAMKGVTGAARISGATAWAGYSFTAIGLSIANPQEQPSQWIRKVEWRPRQGAPETLHMQYDSAGKLQPVLWNAPAREPKKDGRLAAAEAARSEKKEGIIAHLRGLGATGATVQSMMSIFGNHVMVMLEGMESEGLVEKFYEGRKTAFRIAP